MGEQFPHIPQWGTFPHSPLYGWGFSPIAPFMDGGTIPPYPPLWMGDSPP